MLVSAGEANLLIGERKRYDTKYWTQNSCHERNNLFILFVLEISFISWYRWNSRQESNYIIALKLGSKTKRPRSSLTRTNNLSLFWRIEVTSGSEVSWCSLSTYIFLASFPLYVNLLLLVIFYYYTLKHFFLSFTV